MIRNTRQNWNAGAVVRVGFLSLRVVSARAERDGLPDIYTLESLDGSKRYEFVPHNGLTRLESPVRASLDESHPRGPCSAFACECGDLLRDRQDVGSAAQ